MATSSLHAKRRSLKQQTQPPVKRVSPAVARPREVTFDILRIVACFAVVLQHSSAGVLVGYEQVTPHEWWLANILNALSRFAVPVFLMMSGALLINRPGIDAMRFYQRRLSVIIKPYIFGSLIYLLYLLYVKHQPVSYADIGERIIDGGMYYHFYYLHLILALYLLVPFLVIRSQRDMNAALMVSLLLFALTQAELFGSAPYILNSGIGFFAHLPYFLLGSALFHLQKPVPLWLPFLLFLACSAAIAYGTAEHTFMLGHFEPSWLQKSTGWLSMLQASALFLFLCRLVPQLEASFKPHWRRQLFRFARATFGIYIYHVAVVELLYPALLRAQLSHSSAMLATAAFAFVLTGGVILFLQRARILRGWV